MKPMICSIISVSVLLAQAPAEARPVLDSALVRQFDYNRQAPLEIKDSLIKTVDGATLKDISFTGAPGSRVPTHLVVPAGPGPFPAVIFGHWGYTDRTEFLAEALAYGKASVVAAVVDFPWVRQGQDRKNLGVFTAPEGDSLIYVQSVIDLRRTIDFLTTLGNVDTSRIAYVGHSIGAQMGAIVSAVDRRIKATVLMGGVPRTTTIWRECQNTDIATFRDQFTPEQQQRFYAAMEPLDAIAYIEDIAPTPVLFQFALFETYFGRAAMEEYFQAAGEPKQVFWYNSGHELNDPKALGDRVSWLADRLGWKELRRVVAGQ